MEEAELVRRMKNKDKEAFEQLYEKYKDSVYRTACLICGNRTDGEDIAQETFVKIYLHCGELKNNERFRYWLFKVLQRTAWQMIKKQRCEKPDDLILEKLGDKTCGAPMDILLLEEYRCAIWQAIRELDYKHRAVVVLYYYNELTTRQIAQVMGCLEGTVKSRLFVARKKLAKLLPEEIVQEVACYEK